MKLQHLAIVFVIIILPISLVVGEYIQMQIDTITLQKAYSSKLHTATYDAVKAFTLNTINNKYSTISNSKIRDIEASINTFYTSLGKEISVLDNTPDNELKGYTPALLYTLYDGYYIYSKYYNQTVGEYEFGLKPYIYYTCRYKAPAKIADGKNSVDIIVNYTLDNYVTIYGTIGNNYITKSGNIIDPEMVTNIYWNNKGDLISLSYGKDEDAVEITREVLKEYIYYVDENNKEQSGQYSYIVYNGNKVYYDNDKGEYFTLNRNKRQKVQGIDQIKELQKYTYADYEGGPKVLHSDSALKYYYEAYLFSNWVDQYLSHVNQGNAVDQNGQNITDFAVNTGDKSIFSAKKLDIRGSTFDLNRLSVIRKSIQTNLLTAIATFDNKSQNAYSYVLPVFSEEDWESITNNISVISFLQGIPIGSKYFNDYCVITNNVNKELVTLDSLYAITADGEVHLSNCRKILDNKKEVIKVYKNIDFERQTAVLADDNERYYYPHYNTRCYSCLVNAAEIYDIDYVIGDVNKYNKDKDDYENINNTLDSTKLKTLRKEVLQAYGRESYDLYKVNDYFRGYDETITPNSITNEKTDNLETIQYWMSNEHTARVAVKKKPDVEASLKIQYIISRKENPINSMTISDNNNWITLENQVPGNFSEIPERLYLGDQVYIRLADEKSIYDGEYVRITIRDEGDPKGTNIKIIDGEYRSNTDYYVSDTIKVQVTLGEDKESGVGSLKYSYSVDGNLIQEKTIKIEDIIDGKVTFDISEDGTIIIEAITIDLAGNTDIKTSYPLVVKKDSVAPEKPTIEIIGDKKDDYYNGDIKVKFTFGKDLQKNDGKSSASGIERLDYKIESVDGEKTITRDGTMYEDKKEIQIPNDMTGVIKITAWMKDNAGNTSEASKTISKDAAAPQIITDLYATEITTKSFKLNVVTSDVGSGLEQIIWYYKKKDVDNTDKSVVTTCEREKTQVTKSKILENLTTGTYIVYAEIYDVAGNKKKTKEIEVKTITMKPLDSATIIPSGWTNGKVTVTLPSPENGYITEYQINGVDEGKWTKYTAPVEITENNKTVYYRYSDGVNKVAYKTAKVINIDKENPEIIKELAYSDVTTNSFKLKVTVKDTLSGLGKIVWYYNKDNEGYNDVTSPYKSQGSSQSGDTGEKEKEIVLKNLKSGTYKVYAVVYDVAGNSKKTKEITIEIKGIDKPVGATIKPKYWTNGDVTVTLPISTDLTTQYKDSTNGVYQEYSKAFTVTSNRTITYRYSDGINTSGESSISIDKIDKVAPEIIAGKDLSYSDVKKDSFKLSVTVQDKLSGLGKIVWKLDGNASYEPKETAYTTLNGETAGTTSEETKTQIITVSKVGTYKVYAEIYDVAGNKIETQTIIVKMHSHDDTCKHKHTGSKTEGTGCYQGDKTTEDATCKITVSGPGNGSPSSHRNCPTCKKENGTDHTAYGWAITHSSCGAGTDYGSNGYNKCNVCGNVSFTWGSGTTKPSDSSHKYTITVYKANCGYNEGDYDCGY